MSLPNQTQVLIVGAGPTGLACAITLAGLGVQVTIVDSSSINQNGSRATVVHAHTLEILDTIGLAEPLMYSGMQSNGPVFHGSTDKLLEFDLSRLRDVTKFPVSLHIPQHEVEQIFRERLSSDGIQILRNKSVVGIKEVINGLEVAFEDGDIVQTQYVVGTDGSRSTVRRISGIDFKDPHTGAGYDDAFPPSSLQMVLTDVYLKEPLPPSLPSHRTSLYLDKPFVLVPLLSGIDAESHKVSSWRIGFATHTSNSDIPRNPSLEYLQQQLDAKNPWGVEVTIASVARSSRYRVRSAIAGTFFKKLGEGNILLAGDAAHVHSPAGGQGMNLGICDAVALGHAIQWHLDARSNRDLGQRDLPLHQYAALRRETALRVISMAKGLTALMTAGTGWRRIARNMAFRVIRNLPFLRRLAAWRMSGLVHRVSWKWGAIVSFSKA